VIDHIAGHILENGELRAMKEPENRRQMNPAEAPATYEAPALEVLEVEMPKGFCQSMGD
jgi:hypothetical protein